MSRRALLSACLLFVACRRDPSSDAPKVAVTVIPPAASSPEPSGPAPSSSSSATLAKSDFDSKMAWRVAGMKNYCFVPHGGKPTDCVEFRVTIEPDGSVSTLAIEKSTADPLISSCVAKYVRATTFPKTATRATYPFSICG